MEPTVRLDTCRHRLTSFGSSYHRRDKWRLWCFGWTYNAFTCKLLEDLIQEYKVQIHSSALSPLSKNVPAQNVCLRRKQCGNVRFSRQSISFGEVFNSRETVIFTVNMSYFFKVHWKYSLVSFKWVRVQPRSLWIKDRCDARLRFIPCSSWSLRSLSWKEQNISTLIHCHPNCSCVRCW